MLLYEKTSIYLAVVLSLREISYVLYVHGNNAKIVRSRDAQFNREELL